MDSRKVVLLNLCAGKDWRCRCGEWTCGHSEGRGGDEWRVALTTIMCKITCKTATGKLLNNTGSSTWYSVMTDLCCMTETNTLVGVARNFPPLKK